MNVIGQTAFRDHVRECHDRHSRLMLQIMDPILRKIDTVYIYPIYNIPFRKFVKNLALKNFLVKIVSAGGNSSQQQTISVIAHATTLQESWSFF